MKDADSAENNPNSKNIVITPVSCAIPNRAENAPKLSGKIPEIRIRPGSYLEGFYKKDVVTEEFFCNYEVSPDFEGAIIEAGFAREWRDPRHRSAKTQIFHRNPFSAAALVESRETTSDHR
jgi:CTP synthase (UTP-ammonia lyase)